jgi:hypothetical protein
VAASPLVVLVAQAFCFSLAVASFHCAYGYPRSVEGIAIVLPRLAASPLVVLVAQAFCPDPASASFDAASPHDQWSVGCISIVAESLLVVLAAQAFCGNLATASFDCAYGYPRSVGGIPHRSDERRLVRLPAWVKPKTMKSLSSRRMECVNGDADTPRP